MVKPFTGDWYTQPKKETDTWIEQLLEPARVLGVKLSFGKVAVTETGDGLPAQAPADHEVIDLQALDLPADDVHTQALWYELPPEICEARLPPLAPARRAALPPSTRRSPCSRSCACATAGTSAACRPTRTRRPATPTIFIYDGHPGGVGITRRGFQLFDVLVGDAHRLVSECPCADGCPSCVQSPKCGNLNEPLSKRGAVELMQRMLQGERTASGA
jgi:DEAD/DEAH box helicase domain-containing protein